MNRRNKLSEISELREILLLFGLVFVRYCGYGLQYFPQLDDYIQLHNYTAYHPDVWAWMQRLGVLAARPAAGVLDIVFWGHIWPALFLGLALLSAMYAAAVVLFRRVWGKYFQVGWVFLIACALLPLNMEGTYWISAANRVIPCIFFAALSMALFQCWCETGKKHLLAGYFFTQLAAFSFYEQGLVLSVTGVFLVAFWELRKHFIRALGAFLTFVNAGIYFAFTACFSQSALYSARAEIVLPWRPGWWKWVGLPAVRQIKDAFLKGSVYITCKGFLRGAKLVLSEGHWLWLAVVLILCAVVFLLARRDVDRPLKNKTALALLTGFLLTLAPVTIFLVLGNPWFSLRGTVASFCGGALMADTLLNWLLGRLRNRETIFAVLCGAAALVFCTAALSELHDYKATYENDQAVMSAICNGTQNGHALPAKGDTLILGIEPTYLPEQTFYFHEHIHGITESRWALTGGLQCVSGWKDFPYVNPMPASVSAEQFASTEYAALYLYDLEKAAVHAVTAQQTPDGSWDLLDAAGTLLGRVSGEGLERA